ncbi:MAG: multiheme c-type cytochrome [Desulfobulbaceae bacterium]|nr:multiheme c-type cytochrome [Desulfobulbaceae bacterium]
MKQKKSFKKLVSLSGIMMAAMLVSGTAQAGTGDKCISCHQEKNPGMYKQWKNSKHAANDVGCIDCHQADKKDVDAFDHHGATIATLVTPKDCSKCHEAEAEQAMNSYHAHAGEILDSADAYLAHVAGGQPVAITGCETCHGGKVKIDNNEPNKLSKKTWPNSGIGRINPDGSKGSCNACHSRHSFSAEQARQPENCGKCHLGPDHPQKEIYEESKHGIAYYANKDKMNMDKDNWVVGEDYYEAPTCATCHISATKTQKITHDVGDRISWTLRPPISKHKDNWEAKRGNMKDVCLNCHQDNFVNGHYYQYDALVELYNEKFAKPATTIIKMIKDKKLLERKAAFSNTIEWEYWELWHHEGRRARMGAAMMGPDYTWWHGIYDVAHNFYFKFIPEARHYNDPEINAYIDNMLQNDPMHKWINTPTADLKAAIRSGELQKTYEKLFDVNKK